MLSVARQILLRHFDSSAITRRRNASLCLAGNEKMRRVLCATGMVLLSGALVRAQPPEVPVTDQMLLPGPQAQGYPPPGGPMPGEEYGPPPGAEPLGEPPWCDSPYRGSAWRIELSLIPMSSHVSEQAFGEWDNGEGAAVRLTLGYEGCDGFGTRLVFWGFGTEADTLAGDVELGASTFYWDFYKRFFIQQAELVLGGGLAGSHLEYDLKDFNDDANFSGGGLTIFGEGFYPFWRFAKTDIGSIGRARLALLSGEWQDNGTPFVNDADHDLMTIVELAWGLEIRRRFGRTQDKYWYFDIVPEFQRWDSASLPDVFDPGFQGTNFTFGLAW
jgi:hypothetical protein